MSTTIPYLGQRVMHHDPYLVQQPGLRTPRLAFVSGVVDAVTVHLTVFNNPEDDCWAKGMGPTQAVRRVLFVADGSRVGPTVAYCVPADDLVPASSLKIDVVGKIPRSHVEVAANPARNGTATEPRTLGGKFDAADAAGTGGGGAGGGRVYEPVNEGPPIEGEPVTAGKGGRRRKSG